MRQWRPFFSTPASSARRLPDREGYDSFVLRLCFWIQLPTAVISSARNKGQLRIEIESDDTEQLLVLAAGVNV
jgi:hypothetical protein